MITMTDTKTIDKAKVLDLLRQASKGREDYVYEAPVKDDPVDSHPICVYEHNDEPSCLVGHVLHALGVPLSELRHIDTLPGGATADSPSVTGLIKRFAGEITEDALLALSRAQRAQDTSRPWGEAVREAEAPSGRFN